MPKYTLCFTMPCSRKISLNLLELKLLWKWWWNWHRPKNRQTWRILQLVLRRFDFQFDCVQSYCKLTSILVMKLNTKLNEFGSTFLDVSNHFVVSHLSEGAFPLFSTASGFLTSLPEINVITSKMQRNAEHSAINSKWQLGLKKHRTRRRTLFKRSFF